MNAREPIYFNSLKFENVTFELTPKALNDENNFTLWLLLIILVINTNPCKATDL